MMYLLAFILAFGFLYFLMSFARGFADRIDSHRKKDDRKAPEFTHGRDYRQDMKDRGDDRIIEVTDFEIKDDDN